MDGRCLCGAVRIILERHDPRLSVCHCDACRRWGGGPSVGLAAPADAVAVTGPARARASSPVGERAWCDLCGTQLWFRGLGPGGPHPFELSPGLFDRDGGWTLAREVYADRRNRALRLEGDHGRVSRAAHRADHPHAGEEVGA